MQKILNVVMTDGSRYFGALPQRTLLEEVYSRAGELPGANVHSSLADCNNAAWIDFEYAGYHFAVNDQCGEYLFFAKSHNCPDTVLAQVMDHFAALLGREDCW